VTLTAWDGLTETALRTGSFIDFEARKEGPQALLGIRMQHEGGWRTEQIILDHELWPLAALEATYAEASSETVAISAMLPEALEAHLSMLVGRTGGPLVAWSRHDCDVLNELAPGLSAPYLDAKKPAKAWWRTTLGGRPSPPAAPRGQSGRHRLAFYAELAEYEIPAIAGSGTTGERIRKVRDALAKKPLEDLTPTQRGYWTKVLKHNFHDLRAMPAILAASLLT